MNAAAVHRVPAALDSLQLEPAGRVTHYVVWQVQRWSDRAQAFMWADAEPVPCASALEAEIVRVDAMAREERCVRIIERFGMEKLRRLVRNLVKLALELERRDLAELAVAAGARRGVVAGGAA